jgi:hypothetical protein
METLKPRQLCTFPHNSRDAVHNAKAGLPISCKPGHVVTSYAELIEKVAALNFYNPSLHMFFRGQRKDYQNYTPDGKPVRSNLYPSILRSLPVEKSERAGLIRERLTTLERADALVKDRLQVGYIHRHMLVRWSLLQHYEVCQTPLLDLTDSLEVALTFAVSNANDDAYLYVFGLPHQTGPISISIDSMTQVVDLSKLCPPEVSRPHFQSAFLAADYPTAVYPEDLVQKAPLVEANFSCRLLTKFRLESLSDWIGGEFSPLPRSILFPNERDKWFQVLDEIRVEVAQQDKSSGRGNPRR